jgi:hypothetical protein
LKKIIQLAESGMAKKPECNYGRNIFGQLEETIELAEKLREEIKELKIMHREETRALNESHRRELKSVSDIKGIQGIKDKRHEKELEEAAEKKAVYKNEIELVNA